MVILDVVAASIFLSIIVLIIIGIIKETL